ncbi:hypothetical protein K1L80_002175 [Vibrio fluvialis]|nr:hypothetical protein [Vibrio fluvialis]
MSFWSDVFFPLLMASAYIFGVPFIQWGVDKTKYRLIEKRRLSTHHSHLSERYESQAKVSELQSKATLEYWQELHKNHAENAAQQIINLKAQVSSKMEQIRGLEVQNRNSESNYSKLMGMNETTNSELSRFREDVSKLNNQLNTETKNAQNWQCAIEEAVRKIESSEPSKLTIKFINECSTGANNTIASHIEKIRSNQMMKRYPQLHEQVSMMKSEIRKLTDNIFDEIKNKLNHEIELSNDVYQILKNAEGAALRTGGDSE